MGLAVVVAVILQAPLVFFALAAVLWWSALAPRLNPFDALYDRTLGRRSGITLKPAPAPRRFAQLLAGSFALTTGASLALGWRTTALVLEGFLVAAIGALVFGGFCLGSFLYHHLSGRADFARRTLPWAPATDMQPGALLSGQPSCEAPPVAAGQLAGTTGIESGGKTK